MRTRSILALILTFSAATFVLSGKEFTYVGSTVCKQCHKAKLKGGQYVIWEQSPHSRSFAGLATDKAGEIAKSAGVADPGTNPQCLGCHAPLAVKAPEFKAEGVTCEVCHGPGSDYKKLNIMQDRAKAAENGLALFNGDPGAIQAHCLKCHQNAHGVVFDFAAGWDKIKHPVPGR